MDEFLNFDERKPNNKSNQVSRPTNDDGMKQKTDSNFQKNFHDFITRDPVPIRRVRLHFIFKAY